MISSVVYEHVINANYILYLTTVRCFGEDMPMLGRAISMPRCETSLSESVVDFLKGECI